MLHQVSRSGLQTVASDVTVRIGCDPNATKHYLTLKRGTATAGTLTVTAVPAGVGTAEAVIYNGSALTQDLAAVTQLTYDIENTLDTIIVSCAGSNGTYQYSYRGA